MAAVSQKIPNLLGGISQQPDPVKLPGQVRNAVNVYLDPTFGCRKRPATEYIASLATDVPADAKWFPIFRDGNEKYAVAMYTPEGGQFTVRVWELGDGTERTVTMDGAAEDYFIDATYNDLSQVTIADYTLIANKKREVTMSNNNPADPNEVALAVVNQVAYNSTYSIDLDGSGGVEETVATSATKITLSPASWSCLLYTSDAADE